MRGAVSVAGQLQRSGGPRRRCRAADSYFGDSLPRFDGNDLLSEPRSRTAAPEAALAAEPGH